MAAMAAASAGVASRVRSSVVIARARRLTSAAARYSRAGPRPPAFAAGRQRWRICNVEHVGPNARRADRRQPSASDRRGRSSPRDRDAVGGLELERAKPPSRRRDGGSAQVAGLRHSRWKRLARPDERTHELAVDGGHVDIVSSLEEKIAGVFGAIDPGGLEIDGLEARLAELGPVLALLERARHAPDPELHAPANLRRHLAAHHHVGHGEAPGTLRRTPGPCRRTD